mmetsp:Transcript_45415/g.108391  ORF Transcript_45415/g.108391 Transcript_45415/m.108391 type:complete len:208 (-) Transcript_45415:2461-3084(-)
MRSGAIRCAALQSGSIAAVTCMKASSFPPAWKPVRRARHCCGSSWRWMPSRRCRDTTSEAFSAKSDSHSDVTVSASTFGNDAPSRVARTCNTRSSISAASANSKSSTVNPLVLETRKTRPAAATALPPAPIFIAARTPAACVAGEAMPAGKLSVLYLRTCLRRGPMVGSDAALASHSPDSSSAVAFAASLYTLPAVFLGLFLSFQVR